MLFFSIHSNHIVLIGPYSFTVTLLNTIHIFVVCLYPLSVTMCSAALNCNVLEFCFLNRLQEKVCCNPALVSIFVHEVRCGIVAVQCAV